ncbi:MAG: hypothetical protein VX265_05945 [Myxococcota bacterium]|nr:hypothetical protein [Myxococcota bacterium]
MSDGLLPVRPRERRVVLVAFGVLFCVLGAHALVETARDALFLQALPVERLPWVYLLVALIGPLISAVPFEAGGRRGLVAWLWASAATILGFWWWVGSGGTVPRIALYVWAGLSISVALVQVWHHVSQRFTVDAAKRVYGVIGSGAVLGAIAGSAAGGAVATALPVQHLLIGAAVLYVAAGVCVFWLGEGTPVPLRLRSLGLGRDVAAVLADPYAGRLVGLGAIATVAFTLVDYLFKEQVAANVAPDDLGTWFALFYACVNLVALVVQILLTGATIRGLGVRRAIAVLPVLLLLGAGGIVGGVGILAALVVKGSEGALKHTLHKTAMEVLYVPVDAALRARTRRVNDLLVLRLAQGAGSLFILGLLGLGGGTAAVAVGVVLLSLVWLGLGWGLRDHYLALFRGILQRGPTGVGAVPTLDLGALEALLQALNSDSDAEVLSSLDLLHQYGRTRLVPSLILFHPSPQVVVRALDLFGRAGRADHLPKTLRLAASPDAEIRAAVIRAHPDHSFALRGVQDDDPVVRCTALAALLTDGGPQSRTVRPVVEAIASGGRTEERIALARALAHQAHGPLQVELLRALARAPRAVERAAAAESIAANPVPAHMPAAIQLLATREARRNARAAIVANPEVAIKALDRALGDLELAENVRIHVPAVLAELASPEAAEVLTRWLLGATDGVLRYRLLRALNRHSNLRPDVPLPRPPLAEAVRRSVRDLYLLLDWKLVLEAGIEEDPSRDTPGSALLLQMLRDRRVNVEERLFRVLDLLHEDDDFEDLWRGALSEDPLRRASSLELLENALPSDFASPIIALLDGRGEELPGLRRLAPGEAFHRPLAHTYDAVMREMFTSGSDSVQAIAAWHVGELGLSALLPALAAIDLKRHPTTREVIQNAIARLEGRSAQALA